MIEIPLDSSPEQKFSINLNGTAYNAQVMYNSRDAQWSISFSIGESPVITGVAVVSGIDILRQYNLPIKNMYVVNTSADLEDATADNLGTEVKLFLVEDDEI